MFTVCPTGIVYEGETPEDADVRDKEVAEHNARFEKVMAAWEPAPMKGYEGWCRKHAPELLEPGGLERMRSGK